MSQRILTVSNFDCNRVKCICAAIQWDGDLILVVSSSLDVCKQIRSPLYFTPLKINPLTVFNIIESQSVKNSLNDEVVKI